MTAHRPIQTLATVASIWTMTSAAQSAAFDPGDFPTRLERAKPAAVSRAAEKSPALARKVMADFAECILKRSPGATAQYLAMFPQSEEARKALLGMMTSDCLGGGNIRFPPELFRGAVYQRMYIRDFGNTPIPSLDAVAPIDYAVGSNAEIKSAPQSIGLRQFADCIVRATPGTAHRLLITALGSIEEQSAFSELSRAMSQCLPSGLELQFSKSTLRALIGEVAYRLRSKAAEPGNRVGGPN